MWYTHMYTTPFSVIYLYLRVFQRYARKDSNNCKLSKNDFLNFMNTELTAFTKNQRVLSVLDT